MRKQCIKRYDRFGNNLSTTVCIYVWCSRHASACFHLPQQDLLDRVSSRTFQSRQWLRTSCPGRVFLMQLQQADSSSCKTMQLVVSSRIFTICSKVCFSSGRRHGQENYSSNSPSDAVPLQGLLPSCTQKNTTPHSTARHLIRT